MAIKIHADSHLDHTVPDSVIDYACQKFSDREEFFVSTIEYPDSLPEIPCRLHLDVPESEVHYAKRGERSWDSRMCKRPPRMVREVTVVAGPHPEDKKAGMVLFSIYGGPNAPREPGDPSLETPSPELEASKAFWKSAALSNE